MKKTIGILLIIACITLFGFRISKEIEFKQNVTGYLKRAASANTIDLANQELTRALDYLDKKNLTTGYTSVIYNTPDEDVDFWYRNLKASQNELQTLRSESALEKTNVLMKLRESLLSSGGKSGVTVPKGLAVYPNNTSWTFLMLLAVLLGFTGLLLTAVAYEEDGKKKQNK